MVPNPDQNVYMYMQRSLSLILIPLLVWSYEMSTISGLGSMMN